MKTFTKTTPLLITALMIFSISFADNFELMPESYVNDIPFNTEAIAAQTLYEQAISVEFSLTDEEYIDDIPFNTAFIVREYFREKAFTEVFEIEEEEYIDDIPFNTMQIALNHSVKLFRVVAENQTLIGLF